MMPGMSNNAYTSDDADTTPHRQHRALHLCTYLRTSMLMQGPDSGHDAVGGLSRGAGR